MVTQQSCIIPRGAERLERLGSGKWEERVGRGGGRGARIGSGIKPLPMKSTVVFDQGMGCCKLY